MSYRARPAGAAGEGEWRVPLALPNLEGYALELASKRLVNFFISRHRLLEDFGKHYKGEIMRNLFSGKVRPPRGPPPVRIPASFACDWRRRRRAAGWT